MMDDNIWHDIQTILLFIAYFIILAVCPTLVVVLTVFLLIGLVAE